MASKIAFLPHPLPGNTFLIGKTPALPERMSIMSERNGVVEGVRGVVEDAIGKAKEITGIVINHDGLREGGRAQQDKAHAAREVAKKEAQAEAARTAKARQKAAAKK
jgi:hypothetical protein